MSINKRYSAIEASKDTGFDRELFSLFREVGLLKGSRVGRYWKYDEEEINDLIHDIRGYDMENEEKIRFFAPYILAARNAREKKH